MRECVYVCMCISTVCMYVIAEPEGEASNLDAGLTVHLYVCIITVWPEILAGNLFWWIGGFESNPPIFHPPKTSQCDVIIIA